MLIPTQNRHKIHEYLFSNGVLVVAKDRRIATHPEINVPNIEVKGAATSLLSRGIVTCHFAWRQSFYTLTEKGVELLREELHLPANVLPATYKVNKPVLESVAMIQPRAARPKDASGPFNPDFKQPGLGRSSMH